jgi:hypothetical protein
MVENASNGWLEGYISLISISPSTKLHIAPDTTPRFVAKDGTLRAVGDYMYDHPETNSYSSCGSDCRYYYQNPQSERKSVDFIGSANSVSDSPTAEPLTVDYSGLDLGEQTIGLQATYTADIEKVTEHEECVEEDDDGDCEEYEWQHHDTDTITDSLTTQAIADVSRYNPTVGTETYSFDDGDVGVTAFPNQPWDSINPPTADRVHGIWRYYTARDTSWDTLKYENTEGEVVTFYSPVKPLTLHGYPDSSGPSVESQAGLPYENAEIENVVSSTPGEPDHDPPDLPNSTSIDTVDGPYDKSSQITIRYADPSGQSIARSNYSAYLQCADRLPIRQHDTRAQVCGVPGYAPNNLTVEGVVRGVDYTVNVSNTDPTEVKQSRLNWTIINSTVESQKIKISLDAVEANREQVDQTVIVQEPPENGPPGEQAKYIMRGDEIHDIIPMNATPPEPPVETTYTDVEPIDTTVAEEAYITVNGEAFNTNASGELVVEAPRESITIDYHPAPFYAAPSIATTPSNENVRPQAEFGGIPGAIYTIVWVAVLLFIPLWFLDGIFGTNWWPPWQDHKYWEWD